MANQLPGAVRCDHSTRPFPLFGRAAPDLLRRTWPLPRRGLPTRDRTRAVGAPWAAARQVLGEAACALAVTAALLAALLA